MLDGEEGAGATQQKSSQEEVRVAFWAQQLVQGQRTFWQHLEGEMLCS